MDNHLESRNATIEPVIKDVESHESLTATVISAVSEAIGSREDCLGPLYDTIEPDGLNRLFHGSEALDEADFQLTFTIEDCKVIVYGDGRVVASPSIDVQDQVW